MADAAGQVAARGIDVREVPGSRQDPGYGLLDRVLAEVEPAVPTHQRAEDQRRAGAQQVLDARFAAHDPVGSASP